MVNLAEFVCGEGAETVPIEERITDVASAMAEAVAEVVGTCTGQGNAVATVSGFSRAETRAEAVGRASAQILTTAEVCGQCNAALESLVETVETVSATAVAEASISVCHSQRISTYICVPCNHVHWVHSSMQCHKARPVRALDLCAPPIAYMAMGVAA